MTLPEADGSPVEEWNGKVFKWWDPMTEGLQGLIAAYIYLMLATIIKSTTSVASSNITYIHTHSIDVTHFSHGHGSLRSSEHYIPSRHSHPPEHLQSPIQGY
ncbi:hypothetical protein ACMFMG_009621 [Clarireedia jacksonii]